MVKTLAAAGTSAQRQARKSATKPLATPPPPPPPSANTKCKNADKKSLDITSKTEAWRCEVCNEESLSDDVQMLECEVCDLRYCHTCLKISEDEYELLSRRADMHWFCASCEGSALLSIKNDKEIAQRCADYFKVLEGRLQQVEASIQDKADIQHVVSLEIALDAKAEKAKLEQLEEKVLSMERNIGPNIAGAQGGGELPKEPPTTVNDSVSELRDREARKDKLVIFNIPESSDEDADDRKLHDISTVVELFDSELDIQTTVTNSVRLGKKQQNATYPRPLRVTVEDEQMKWKVLKASKNLKDPRKEENKLIYIKRDMTRMERVMEEDLRKQLAEKRKEAEDRGVQCSWMIRRGKLVNQQRIVQNAAL